KAFQPTVNDNEQLAIVGFQVRPLPVERFPMLLNNISLRILQANLREANEYLLLYSDSVRRCDAIIQGQGTPESDPAYQPPQEFRQVFSDAANRIKQELDAMNVVQEYLNESADFIMKKSIKEVGNAKVQS
ncbi:unnamed protein product, partial [Choristocarpus tenellus]